MEAKPEISVIIPAYNEEKSIAKVLAHLDNSLSTIVKDYEIIVVSDGSTDKTVDEVKKAQIPDLKIIVFPKNRGKGAALKAGVKEARGEIIIFHDADLILNLETINKSLEEIKLFSAVFASKNLKGSSFARSFFRHWSSIFFNRLITLLLKIPLTDVLTGYKVFRKDLLLTLIKKTNTQRFETDLEICWLMSKERCLFKEIPLVGSSIKRASRFVSLASFYEVLKVLKWAFKTFIKTFKKRANN